MSDTLLDYALIHEAVYRLKKRIRPTELIYSHHFSEKTAIPTWFKCENLQRTGAFKIRGALNAALEARSRTELGAAGAIAYSSGNHGQAVAYADCFKQKGHILYQSFPDIPFLRC
ncbi:MAG: pyridoxal-phosphate dependent enzyme [Desulfobulbaceae bacterium]|nr:pyridoxal-phosphate dependent enzyme [Desulfobulbaceae bacterium]